MYFNANITQNERKKKKSGAAVAHVKLAERLLAAQMRREALNHAQKCESPSSQQFVRLMIL
jgi:DNA excision repair protein ERCC-5